MAGAPPKSKLLEPSELQVGTHATLKTSRLRGRVVRILQARLRMDLRAIAASLEQDKRFSDGCWHCNRLFHRCRRLLGTEAPCESWIGYMKHMYSDVQGPTVTTLARRVRLGLAGVRRRERVRVPPGHRGRSFGVGFRVEALADVRRARPTP